jgi:hypothetical protein
VQIDNVPPPLRERLGEPATVALLDLFDRCGKDWTPDVVEVVTDRFERRLVEENSKLRLEMTQGFAGIQREMATLRQEMTSGFASVRHEMASQRFDILKWAFLFWVGQFFAVASLMVVMMRYLRP